MIPNGKEIIIDGHKVVFESEPSDCRGCFFENRDSCPDCDEGIWVEKGYPWHTGTPTEGGWYLLECNIANSDKTYYVTDYWNNEVGYWIVNGVIRWQKIEPYKETGK